MTASSTAPPRRDRTWLVTLGAAAWGLDGLLRQPLSATLAPATIVFWEHLIVVAAICWLVPSALRAYLRCPFAHKIAIALIGIGASALATALFTKAFALAGSHGDYVTPLLLQKLQPVFVVMLALILLGERLRPSFAVFAVPALAGAWMVSFASPFNVGISAVEVSLLALAAALLWGAGTVLGRMVSTSVSPRDLTVLRYVWGLPAALVIVLQTHAPLSPGWSNVWPLVLLAIIPGVAALSVYYYGLRSTPASRATIAELAFPATAAFIGVAYLDSHLTNSQWAGLAVVAISVLALGWHERCASRAAVVVGGSPQRDGQYPVPA